MKIPDPVVKVGSFLYNVHQLWWIVIASGLGVMFGLIAPGFSKDYLGLLSTSIFLPLVKLLIFPLIFSILIVGIAGHGDDIAAVTRVGIKAIVYFILVTIIAIFAGLLWGNVFQPGSGLEVNIHSFNESVAKEKAGAGNTVTLQKLLEGTIPTSIALAASNNSSLQITFAAIMFAVSMILMGDKPAKNVLVTFFDAVLKAMFKYIDLIMRFVPIAIFGALAGSVGRNGIKLLAVLGKLIGTVYLGLFTFVLVIFLPIALVTRMPLFDFAKALWKPIIIAFSTASSDAALGIAIENLVDFGVPRDIVGFVMPLGYSFNLDGTTLYLGSALLFCAQTGQIELPLGTQVVYMLILLLSSKGIAGVPRASLVILLAAVQQFGLPVEAVSAILGVDEIMDMARTSVNLTGNMLACYVIAKWEGRFREKGWKPVTHEAVKTDDEEAPDSDLVELKVDATPAADPEVKAKDLDVTVVEEKEGNTTSVSLK
ncbi:hypothetical protein HK098_005046 [Nowakowskiella sp. JEL0407]|nr:hypothetical protein HK098_005046 [Nowakowskiella sp. JEL0407]